MTTHGRATPLTWKTVRKSTLAGRRNDVEDEVVDRLHGAIARDVALTLLADRGLGDQKGRDQAREADRDKAPERELASLRGRASAGRRCGSPT
ncbi:MAG: hypothetical protein KF764_26000 [Labilithrix sp.]|nr:hypothetical protein [Labilithrix sp.]